MSPTKQLLLAYCRMVSDYDLGKGTPSEPFMQAIEKKRNVLHPDQFRRTLSFRNSMVKTWGMSQEHTSLLQNIECDIEECIKDIKAGGFDIMQYVNYQ